MALPIADRVTAIAATDLMMRFGEAAAPEAASRADSSRNRGNALKFCHWRQVERLIVALDTERVMGTVH
jgi:hypothetical protein